MHIPFRLSLVLGGIKLIGQVFDGRIFRWPIPDWLSRLVIEVINRDPIKIPQWDWREFVMGADRASAAMVESHVRSQS